MTQFDELLKALNETSEEQAELAKGIPAKDGKDDKMIQAAAEESNIDANEENPENHEEPDDDEGKGKPPMAKSVTATVDGKEVEAIDATEIIKSLTDRVGETEGVLAKGLESVLSTMKAQGEMIKSLSAQVQQLSSKGAGRKSVLTVTEKPASGDTMAKSEAAGISPQDFMAKAHAAFSAGKLSGLELNTADVALRSGAPVPAGIIAKALA